MNAQHGNGAQVGLRRIEDCCTPPGRSASTWCLALLLSALTAWAGCGGGGQGVDAGSDISSGDTATGSDIGGGDTATGSDGVQSVDAGEDIGDDDCAADSDGDTSPPPEIGLTIVFDYRFDSYGFFDPPVTRSCLEEAARIWGVILRDDFDAIPADAWVYVRNPEDTSVKEQWRLEEPIDDLLVVVGSKSMTDRHASSSATASFPAAEDDPALRAALMERWEGSDFEPWTGWISYNRDEPDWFFDPTPATEDDIPSGAVDGISTTLHELGHVLGIAPGGAFAALVDNDHFVGPHAMAEYGGPVPLADGYGHIADGVLSDGRPPLMSVGRSRGVRYLPTPLDIAILVDIGYEVEGY